MARLLLFFLLLSSCSEWDSRLILVNNSKLKIRYRFEIKGRDELIPNLIGCETADLYDVLPHQEQPLRSLNKWDVYFRNHPEDYLRIYIINDDSLKKYGTCNVFKRQIFMKRYDLTYQNLEQLKWRIEYK